MQLLLVNGLISRSFIVDQLLILSSRHHASHVTSSQATMTLLTPCSGVMVLRIGILVVTGLRTVHAFALPSNKAPYSTTALNARAGKFDPFTNMLGDVASSIMGGGQPSGPKNPQLDATLESLSVSWDVVRSTLDSVQTPEEGQFRELLKTGKGPPSPLHKIRLYDDSNSEEDIRVTFYRDSASWCPYCHVSTLEISLSDAARKRL